MSTTPLKVLMLIPGEEEGNSMLFSKRQVLSLRKSGVDCKTFFLQSRSFSGGLFKEILRFKKELQEFNPDIVHSQYGTVTALVASLFSNCKLIITFHGSDLNKTSTSDGVLRDFFGRLFSNIAILRASRVICVSSLLIQMMWWKRNKAIAIPMGIDIDFFSPRDQLEARKQTGWSANEKVVIFNANNPKIKRLDLAEAAIKIAKQSVPDIRLEVLSGNLNQQKMPDYLNAGDCLLLCSDSEGSPMIIKEALACNLPIVSVNVGDVAERIKDVRNCLITVKNPQEIARNICQLIKLNERSDGRQKIKNDQLSEDDIAARIIEVYNSVLR